MTTKFNNADYVDLIERFILSADGRILPEFGLIGNEKPTIADLLDAITRVRTFRKNNNGADPATVNISTTIAKPLPSATDGIIWSPRFLRDSNIVQDTNYFCALNAIQQSIYELYGALVVENTMSSIAGTTTAGTDHAGIERAFKSKSKEVSGKEGTIKWQYFSETGWAKVAEIVKDPDKALFFHDLYRKTWGHYEYAAGVDLNKKIVIIANSLSGGYLEYRSFTDMESYINGISQPSVCILGK